jgi:glycosyltransferase involved in cell wall biosynthesis
VAEAIDDGISGLLVRVDDPDGLADALERILLDPELARRLGAGALAAVRERFDRRLLLPAVPRALAQAGLLMGFSEVVTQSLGAPGERWAA